MLTWPLKTCIIFLLSFYLSQFSGGTAEGNTFRFLPGKGCAMSSLGTVAIGMCLVCIGAKWFFTVRKARLEQSLEAHRSDLSEAKKAMSFILNRLHYLTADRRQLEGKKDGRERNIRHLSEVLQGLVKREEAENALRSEQEQLMISAREKSKGY